MRPNILFVEFEESILVCVMKILCSLFGYCLCFVGGLPAVVAWSPRPSPPLLYHVATEYEVACTDVHNFALVSIKTHSPLIRPLA